MKKFLLFSYFAGRPLGGMSDFLSGFETVEEALSHVLPEPKRYFEIVDASSMRIVREGLSEHKNAVEPDRPGN